MPYIASICYVLWYMDCGVEVSESNLSWKVQPIKGLAVIWATAPAHHTAGRYTVYDQNDCRG